MANKENIQKWVDALRSGRFEQTTGALSRDGKYCCLGVACELAIEAGLNINKHITSRAIKGDYLECTAYNDVTGTLPEDVVKWLQVEDENITLDEGFSAANWNDGGGSLNAADFATIADMIENKYLKEV